MTKMDIMNGVTRAFYKGMFQIKKHSPELLLAAGLTGGVASAVMACKASTKLSAVLEESKEQIDQVHTYIQEEGFSEKYTEEDGKKDLALLHVQAGIKVVKLYAPAVALGAASIGCILASRNIMSKRNAALAAAYAAVERGFKDYRGRVVERFGEALDRELKYNIKAKEIEEVVTNEDGSETVVKKTVQTVDPTAHNVYTKCFDEHNPNYQKNAEFNRLFLIQQQNYANEKLRIRGYLFLNEVYEMLGFQAEQMGQIVGWIYDEKDPVGDNYVDFGIHDIDDESKRLFVNGHERAIWLDFNPDGNILDLMA